MEFNDMVMVEHLFCHCQFIRLLKPYVPVVVLYSGLCRSTTLSDVDLTTLAGYAVNHLSPQSQISFTGRKSLEIFLGGRPSHLMLCLASILLSRP